MFLTFFHEFVDHVVDMKSNLQHQGYLTHLKSDPHDALNANQNRKSEERVKLCSFVAFLTRVYLTCHVILKTGHKTFWRHEFIRFFGSLRVELIGIFSMNIMYDRVIAPLGFGNRKCALIALFSKPPIAQEPFQLLLRRFFRELNEL